MSHLLMCKEIENVFDTFHRPVRQRLLAVRELILNEANNHPYSDTFVETLKWGQVSYLIKNGSTIRLGNTTRRPDDCALFF